LAKIEKLINKALTDPQNLLFTELCKLCEFFEMKRRKSKSGHIIYKRKDSPKFTLSIQDDGSNAKPYQVKQLIEKVKELGLYDFEEEE
jgi:hypothetical protein